MDYYRRSRYLSDLFDDIHSWKIFIKWKTHECLNIIKIEPNFRSLFYHDSMATSQVHAHTFIEKKLQNCEIVIRFWETFCGVLKGVCSVFFGFFVQLFWHFIGVFDCSVGQYVLSCYHGVQGKDAFYLTPSRRFNQSKLYFTSNFKKIA